MWYEILINGYSWFVKQLNYTSDIKISESICGNLIEPHLTRSEAIQIKTQLNDYQTLGFNTRLLHLNRSGISK